MVSVFIITNGEVLLVLMLCKDLCLKIELNLPNVSTIETEQFTVCSWMCFNFNRQQLLFGLYGVHKYDLSLFVYFGTHVTSVLRHLLYGLKGLCSKHPDF